MTVKELYTRIQKSKRNLYEVKGGVRMSIKKSNSPVAENIKNCIKRKGLKQSFVARKIGIKENDFSAMLNGRKIIMTNLIPVIAAALETDPNTLLGFSEQGVKSHDIN